MLHVFVFPLVMNVIITRHRQNIYLPVYARRWRRVAVVAAAAGVEGEALYTGMMLISITTVGSSPCLCPRRRIRVSCAALAATLAAMKRATFSCEEASNIEGSVRPVRLI
jgi:hypothetical protein